MLTFIHTQMNEASNDVGQIILDVFASSAAESESTFFTTFV